MDLPTLLVIIFLVGGNVYQETVVAPSIDACNSVQLKAQEILTKSLGQVPEAMATACITMRPISKDA